MGRWKIHGCPRCNGSLIIDKDEDGWFEQCINCAYRNELRSYGKPFSKPILKEAKSLSQSINS
jgi:DNA-directed RNA polymerase subunit M/transcription elongation factor TFIIS